MTTSKLVLPLVLFVLTIAVGFWVSKTGKPYNTGIFTLHKMLALAHVVISAITITGLLKTTHSQTFLIVLIILAVLSVLTLFGSGAIMSIQKTVSSAWLLIHRVAPIIFAGTVITVIWLITKTQQ
ncbi:MAG: hypothetical protein FP831_13025 [Anaerolineae bacterium]|nr:hypothetical protein [Anaerolineae bacterium]